MPQGSFGGQRPTFRTQFPLLPCEAQSLNSGCQAWRQVPFTHGAILPVQLETFGMLWLEES